LDLEALLSPSLPFERKAREELRATDDEIRGDASGDLALPHAVGSAREPAQRLRGSQGLFDIIAPSTTQTDDPGAHGRRQTLAAGTASSSGDAAVDDTDPAAIPTAIPTAIPPPSHAPIPAVSQSAAADQLRHSERTAVGFVDGTARQLRQIESMLGHPQPAKAIGDLQARVSEQITPRLSPEVQIDDQAIEQMLRELDLIGAGGPRSGAGAADVTDRD
jgi:hypothetical protein